MIKILHLTYDRNLDRDSDSFKAALKAKIGEISYVYGILNGEFEGVSYEHVANVDTDNLNQAYEYTNSITGPWYSATDTGVTMLPAYSEGARSSSPGDVFINDEGEIIMVANFGFRKLHAKSPNHTETHPPIKLFNLSDLQKSAYDAHMIGPRVTLEIADSLHEKGFISYPRTESNYLPVDKIPEIEKLISDLQPGDLNNDLSVLRSQAIQEPFLHTSSAIVPTTISAAALIDNPLSQDEMKIYKLIVDRFKHTFTMSVKNHPNTRKENKLRPGN